MSQALQRIDETREALIGALAERNWEAVGELTWDAAQRLMRCSVSHRWTKLHCARS